MNTVLSMQLDERSANISACGQYRYWLTRRWGLNPMLYWVMLNPSTADAHKDDHTIRKCIGFAKRNGYEGICVLNLFAYRCTDPRELVLMRSTVNIVGPENDTRLSEIPEDATVVCGWGAFPYNNFQTLHPRIAEVRKILSGRTLMCVKKTDVAPWHPLYVKYGLLSHF